MYSFIWCVCSPNIVSLQIFRFCSLRRLCCLVSFHFSLLSPVQIISPGSVYDFARLAIICTHISSIRSFLLRRQQRFFLCFLFLIAFYCCCSHCTDEYLAVRWRHQRRRMSLSPHLECTHFLEIIADHKRMGRKIKRTDEKKVIEKMKRKGIVFECVWMTRLLFSFLCFCGLFVYLFGPHVCECVCVPVRACVRSIYVFCLLWLIHLKWVHCADTHTQCVARCDVYGHGKSWKRNTYIRVINRARATSSEMETKNEINGWP